MCSYRRLNISSTVHNIIKESENLEKSLQARDRAESQCMASGALPEITVNTVCRAITNAKSTSTKAVSKWTVAKWKTFLLSDELKFVQQRGLACVQSTTRRAQRSVAIPLFFKCCLVQRET